MIITFLSFKFYKLFNISFSYSFWLTAPSFMPMFPAFQALKYLLLVLFVLHIMWTYFILKILQRALLSGMVNLKKKEEFIEFEYILKSIFVDRLKKIRGVLQAKHPKEKKFQTVRLPSADVINE